MPGHSKLLVLLLLPAALAFASSAHDPCRDLARLPPSPQSEAPQSRDLFLRWLQENKLPAFLKKSGAGYVPVLLMNPKTMDSYRAFLSASFGTVVDYRADRAHDHALMRLGQTFLDFDATHGHRDGETHETGIYWNRVFHRVPFLGSHLGHTKIETAFLLTERERETAEYYHRLRRAGILHIPFLMGRFEGTVFHPRFPSYFAFNYETLLRGEENCFGFAKGLNLGQQRALIETRLREITEIPESSPLPDARTFLSLARQAILNTRYLPQADADSLLHPKFLETVKVKLAGTQETRPLISFLPKLEVPIQQKQKAARWWVALDAFTEYQSLIDDLGLTSDLGLADSHLPRVSAILVYDSNEAAVAQFQNATYENTQSVFSKWRNEDQIPIRDSLR